MRPSPQVGVVWSRQMDGRQFRGTDEPSRRARLDQTWPRSADDRWRQAVKHSTGNREMLGGSPERGNDRTEAIRPWLVMTAMPRFRRCSSRSARWPCKSADSTVDPAKSRGDRVRIDDPSQLGERRPKLWIRPPARKISVKLRATHGAATALTTRWAAPIACSYRAVRLVRRR